jgi:hypothetical protein
MPFAAGFILFFYLDIFVSNRFTSIGLMLMMIDSVLKRRFGLVLDDRPGHV